MIIALTLLVSCYLEIERVLINPTYTQFISDDFEPYIANELKSSTIDTNNQTLAATIITINSDDEFAKTEYEIARIQYYLVYQNFNTDTQRYDNLTREWINSAYCHDLYADRMDSSSKYYQPAIESEFPEN